jgi:hypothetical protein
MKRFAWFSALVVLMGCFVPDAEAVVIRFVAHLDGPSENPPVASLGTGVALVVYDSLAHTLGIEATFQDLVGTTTIAHIHCCVDPPGTVGVATFPGTFPGFPVGVTSGTYVSPSPIDLTLTTSYTANFLSTFGGGTAPGAEAALLAGIQGGRAYFNIHSSFAGGGEIRGFLQQVPEPGTLGVLALGMVSALVARRRARGSLTRS